MLNLSPTFEQYSIAPMQETHLDKILLIDPLIFPTEDPFSKEQLRNYFGEGFSFIAKNDKEEIIGYLFLRKQYAASFFIGNFGVLNNWQGHGIGQSLMNHAIQAVSQSADEASIALEVRATNAQAIRFYEKYGFLNAGQGGRADFISMKKNISAEHDQQPAVQVNETENLKEELRAMLQAYIDRIKSYKKDYSRHFWFFSESRAVNRKANYKLAKKLKEKIEHVSIDYLFRNEELLRLRKEFFKFDERKHERRIHSSQLNKVIEKARTFQPKA